MYLYIPDWISSALFLGVGNADKFLFNASSETSEIIIPVIQKNAPTHCSHTGTKKSIFEIRNK